MDQGMITFCVVEWWQVEEFYPLKQVVSECGECVVATISVKRVHRGVMESHIAEQVLLLILEVPFYGVELHYLRRAQVFSIGEDEIIVKKHFIFCSVTYPYVAMFSSPTLGPVSQLCHLSELLSVVS